MPNYFYYDYARAAVCEVRKDTANHVPAVNAMTYLNQLCLEHGSTLEGRKAAFRYKIKQRKFTPIYVSTSMIYFPIESTRHASCKWVNYAEIEDVDYKEKRCTIRFKDHTSLTVENPQRIRATMHHIWCYLHAS
ncbi:competence protein ComK [Catenisphaera adipataccumulans]|uniref:Competence protein ComK n=1 Tax=Catenisphaera adipataccumulans TaxID=700500 RepID=A0A7W8CYU4_9FIRM|nr:competence protein ComK [Catenisphaera adipataccumulans]MBB5183886.1 competence protein ComK [Catenisphaera adipataccumulans]